MSKYKMVPVEPTREMWAAAGDAVVALNSHHHDAISEAVYKAMLAAAPAMQDKPVEWPLASKEDAGWGWTIDYRFLEQVEEVASLRTDFTTSMEAAEQVLIAAAELLAGQQSAPDVTQLVEVLESAKNLIANHSGEVLPDEYAGDQIEQIDAALAAYRKQGGDV